MMWMACTTSEFQSTLSMRRATFSLSARNRFARISIHALHEESDFWETIASQLKFISIHALHEESDMTDRLSLWERVFQSTLSMRRATRRQGAATGRPNISIHALHEESDRLEGTGHRRRRISIHALHEESD